jgi:[NiFe] hydrogenase assembly HybE family chaperone
MCDHETAAEPGASAQAHSERVRGLVAEFERIGAESMRGLPFYNEALAVEALGFERLGDEWLGILITPWFLNLMLAPEQPIPYAEAANGRKRILDLPGGPVQFLCGGTENFGLFYAHSIASPMHVYKTQDQARAAARRAIVRASSPPEATQATGPQSGQAVSRRNLFSFAGRPVHSEPPG